MGARIRNPKVIEKPWGREIILEHNERYALKDIRMLTGTRSSLQSHSFKLETIFVISGKIELETIDGAGTPHKDTFEAEEAFTLVPGVKHRIRVVEDCHLLEASTPELDDITRYQDDFGRL